MAEIRDAGEEVIEGALNKALSEGVPSRRVVPFDFYEWSRLVSGTLEPWWRLTRQPDSPAKLASPTSHG